MRESCTSGSVRGARGNSRPYRNVAICCTALVRCWHERDRPSHTEADSIQALLWVFGRPSVVLGCISQQVGKRTYALLLVVREATLLTVRSQRAPEGLPMKCSKCGHENRTGAKFCEECATPLARACPNCGSEFSTTAKFCPECAHPVGIAPKALAAAPFTSPESYTPKHLAEKILISKSALEGERKQVTVLFADLKGSMELLADRDPEEARKVASAQ